MFVTLLTIVSCHFVTLISIKFAPVLSTSGDNFREENGKKLVRAISAESTYRCMLLFLDHRAHFVHDAQSALRAVLAITHLIYSVEKEPTISYVKCGPDQPAHS